MKYLIIMIAMFLFFVSSASAYDFDKHLAAVYAQDAEKIEMFDQERASFMLSILDQAINQNDREAVYRIFMRQVKALMKAAEQARNL